MKIQQNKNILPPKEFAKRVLKYTVFASGIIVFSLGIGVLGYHHFGNLNWLDSFYNASMILTGMGPVNTMRTDSQNITSIYVMYSGVIFLSTFVIFFAPFAHRLMHLLRIDKIDKK